MSSRLPGKNTRNFHGKPIICYSIEAALASKYVDKVMVSTDDPETMEIAKSCGAVCDDLRPKSLADAYSTSTDVIVYEIKRLLKECMM